MHMCVVVHIPDLNEPLPYLILHVFLHVRALGLCQSVLDGHQSL